MRTKLEYDISQWPTNTGQGNEGKFNPITTSCENAMCLSVPGIPAPCQKFPQSVNGILNNFVIAQDVLVLQGCSSQVLL
jgi:hypothetical protein